MSVFQSILYFFFHRFGTNLFFASMYAVQMFILLPLGPLHPLNTRLKRMCLFARTMFSQERKNT